VSYEDEENVESAERGAVLSTFLGNKLPDSGSYFP